MLSLAGFHTIPILILAMMSARHDCGWASDGMIVDGCLFKVDEGEGWSY